MRPWRLVTTVTIIALAAVSLTQPAFASSFTVQLNGDQFRIAWEIDAMQNLTALSKTSAFPQNLNYSLTGADLTFFTSALQTALQSRIPTIVVAQPSASLSSSSTNVTCQFHCPLQWLNLTIAFDVQEPVALTYGARQFDLSWIAFRVGDNLYAVGKAFNTLGQNYLLQAMPAFFPKPTPGRTYTVSVDGQLVSKTNYQQPVQQIVLLDTSPLTTPLEDWTHDQDLNAGVQTWHSPNIAGFNITANLQIVEVDLVSAANYFAAARVSAKFSAPLSAHAQGNVLVVDFSDGLWEKAAAATIIAAIAALITTTILDKRMTRTSQRRRRPKNR